MAVLSVLTVALAISSGVTAKPMFGFGDSSDSSSFTPGAGGFGDFTPGAGGFGGGATPSAGGAFGDFTPGAGSIPTDIAGFEKRQEASGDFTPGPRPTGFGEFTPGAGGFGGAFTPGAGGFGGAFTPGGSFPTDIAGFEKRQEATGDFTPGPKPTGPPPSGFTPGAGGFGGAFTPQGPPPTGTPPAGPPPTGTPPSGAAPTGAPSKRWWIWGRADEDSEEDGEDAASGSQPTPTGPPSGDFTPGAGGDFTAPAGGEFTPGADFTPGAGGFGGHGHHTPGAGGFGHGHHTPGAGGDFTFTGAPTGDFTPSGAAPTSFFTRTRPTGN